MNNSSKTLLSLAAALLVAATAQAQTVTTGDILVGFRSSGALNNLEVKAGSVTTLQSYSSQTLIGNFNTSLTALSATWSTATSGTSAVLWGAAGTSSSTLIYGSYTWGTTAGTLGTANSAGWAPASVGTGNTKINSTYTGFNGISATATGDGISKTIAASQTNSWSTQGGTGASAFGAYNPNNNGFAAIVGANVVSGANYVASDLYSVAAGTSTYLGTFALYTTAGSGYSVGDLTFTAASAVPEPSTYAAIAGAAALGLVILRRRRQAAAVNA